MEKQTILIEKFTHKTKNEFGVNIVNNIQYVVTVSGKEVINVSANADYMTESSLHAGIEDLVEMIDCLSTKNYQRPTEEKAEPLKMKLNVSPSLKQLEEVIFSTIRKYNEKKHKSFMDSIGAKDGNISFAEFMNRKKSNPNPSTDGQTNDGKLSEAEVKTIEDSFLDELKRIFPLLQ